MGESFKNSKWEKPLRSYIEKGYMVAKNILTRQYRDRELRKEIHRRCKIHQNNQEKYERLKKLQKCFQNLDLRELKYILCKYSVAYEQKYAMEIYYEKRFRGKGSSLLRDIWLNEKENPMMRLLAARMLIDSYDKSAIIEMYIPPKPKDPEKTKRKKAKPEKTKPKKSLHSRILASAAFRMASMVNHFPEISSQKLKKLDLFYKILYALYMDPNKQEKIAQALFQNENSLVSLCAVYNFRRYRDSSRPKTFSTENLNRRLIELMNPKEKEDIRTKAFEVFWNFRCLKDWSYENRQIWCQKNWEMHGSLIAKFLEEKNEKFQYAAIFVCTADHFLRRFIQEKVNKDSKTFLRFYSALLKLTKPSFKTHFWATIALSLLDKQGKIEKIIANKKTPFFVRINTLFTSMSRKKAKMRLVTFIQKELKTPISTEDDKLFRQMLLISLGYFSHRLKISIFQQHLLDALKSDDIKKAAISGLLWAGSYRCIKKIKPYLKSRKLHIKRAAITSLAGIYIRHRPQKIPQFHKYIRKNFPRFKRAAALGYYLLIRSDMSNKLYSTIKKESFQEDYDMHIQALKKTALSKSDKDSHEKHWKRWMKKSRKWLIILEKAHEIDPSSFYLYEKAFLHYYRREYEKTIQECRKALGNKVMKKVLPIHRRKYHKMRIFLLQAKATFDLKGKGLGLLKKAERFYPLHPEISILYGKIFRSRKNIEKSNQCFLEAYLKNPENPKPLYETIQNHLDSKKYENAVRTFELSHSLHPRHVKSYREEPIICRLVEEWKFMPREIQKIGKTLSELVRNFKVDNK